MRYIPDEDYIGTMDLTPEREPEKQLVIVPQAGTETAINPFIWYAIGAAVLFFILKKR